MAVAGMMAPMMPASKLHGIMAMPLARRVTSGSFPGRAGAIAGQ
jgi:hypothetical protein